MSLQTAAEAVRQKGRGEDTMLIHMTPGEVKGLQQLAMAYGGSLTVNPETGLPEASFLKSLLPTLIGAGLMFVPGMQGVGAGFLGGTAGMIGAGVGALEFARTGDLGKGIMAGLGAYGGAGLAGGALAAGRQAAVVDATAKLGPVADQMTAAEVLQATGNAPANTFMGNLQTAGSGLGNITGLTGSQGGQAAARDAFVGTAADSATGQAATGLGGGMGVAKTAGAALAGPLTVVPPAQTIEPEESNYDGPYVPTERQVRFPTAERDPMDSSEFQFFDVVNPAPGFQTMASATPPTTDLSGEPTFAGLPISLAANPDRVREYQANPNLYSFAKGGMTMDNGGFVVDAHTVSEIGNGSSDAGHERLARLGGEPIEGPGDGVSDSIKANIGGVQEARIARDESYLSREDVKALGGGNLKKGEKMLYKLMAEAHKSRKQKGRGQATGLDKLISRMA